MQTASPNAAGSEHEPRVAGAVRRVGIINIMPRAETYEQYLIRPLLAAAAVEPVWLRLESHVYSSSDAAHVRGRYLSFDAALRHDGGLDGLILTGAPVEELEFSQVRYFGELAAILEHARRQGLKTLGLCWGGLALGHLLGMPKVALPKKLFGVFEERRLDPNNPLLGGIAERFPCVHSRHAALDQSSLERAAEVGTVRLLARGDESGYSMFETGDGVFTAHLGHPEYPARRLLEEWQRDVALGRSGIEPPRNYDLQNPRATWAAPSDRFFANWLLQLARPATLRP